MVGHLLRSEVFDKSTAGVGPSHDLPVRYDLVGAFDDGTRPAQFLSTSDVQVTGVQSNAARLNLLNRHPRIAWSLPYLSLSLIRWTKSVSAKLTRSPRGSTNNLSQRFWLYQIKRS